MVSDKTVGAKIIKMREADVNAVLKIMSENNLEIWSYQDFLSEIERENSITLVGILNEEVVVFCVARLIINHLSNSLYSDYLDDSNNNAKNLVNDNYGNQDINFISSECEIYNIAVKKNSHNQGIGRQIMNEIVSIAKTHNTTSIWLEVRTSNTEALNFYRRNNFNQIYKRKNFYSNPPEDAVVMRRDLL